MTTISQTNCSRSISLIITDLISQLKTKIFLKHATIYKQEMRDSILTSKKYSSFDKQQVLTETFRAFVKEAREWDSIGGRYVTPYEDTKSKERADDRNWGLKSREIYSGDDNDNLTTRDVPDVLAAIHKFLDQSGEAPSGAAEEDFKEFFSSRKDLLDELIAQTKVPYMEAEEGSLSAAMHSSSLYNDVNNIKYFRLGGPDIVRSVLKHIGKTP
jgi:hypothetical protein